MTRLARFLDDDRRGRWANIVMDNGDPCWVSIARTGVLVKRSRVGLFGPKLYEERNLDRAAETAMALAELFPDKLTPDGMENRVLAAFVNAALHCGDLARVTVVLSRAVQLAKGQQGREGTAEASHLVTLYTKVLGDASAGVLRPESSLPARPEGGKRALIADARATLEAGELDGEGRRVYREAYAALAYFVADDDAATATRLQERMKSTREASDEDLRQLARDLDQAGDIGVYGVADALGRQGELAEEFERRLADESEAD